MFSFLESLEMTVKEIFAKSNSRVLSWHNFCYILINSPLKNYIQFRTSKLTAYKGFQYMFKLTKENLKAEELATLQVLASFLYLLPNDNKLLQSASQLLLRQTFLVKISLEPMIVHYFTENLLSNFKGSRRSSLHYIFKIASFLYEQCAFGSAVAVCIFWNVVFRCGEDNIAIHQFRDLGELNCILRSVPLKTISMDAFCILLQTVGCLLHLMLCNMWQSEFQANGYPLLFFRLLPQDRHNLQAWIKQSLQLIGSKNTEIRRLLRYKADKILASLDYLETNSTQWCLVCRSKKRKETEVCVLGQIFNINDFTKV